MPDWGQNVGILIIALFAATGAWTVVYEVGGMLGAPGWLLTALGMVGALVGFLAVMWIAWEVFYSRFEADEPT